MPWLLEPNGYIGYFSGLKTYDAPGLSSREVVELERRYGGLPWGSLATELRPEWLVLRQSEIAAIAQTHPHLLDEQYVRSHEFDVRDALHTFPSTAANISMSTASSSSFTGGLEPREAPPSMHLESLHCSLTHSRRFRPSNLSKYSKEAFRGITPTRGSTALVARRRRPKLALGLVLQ